MRSDASPSKTWILRWRQLDFRNKDLEPTDALVNVLGSCENQSCNREAAKAPKEPPRDAKEHQKRAQEGIKAPSRTYLDPQPRFIKNVVFVIKWRFLRVGGSAWELEIDTERLQDKENNDLEEESETRNEKSTYIWSEKGSPNKFLA